MLKFNILVLIFFVPLLVYSLFLPIFHYNYSYSCADGDCLKEAKTDLFYCKIRNLGFSNDLTPRFETENAFKHSPCKTSDLLSLFLIILGFFITINIFVFLLRKIIKKWDAFFNDRFIHLATSGFKFSIFLAIMVSMLNLITPIFLLFTWRWDFIAIFLTFLFIMPIILYKILRKFIKNVGFNNILIFSSSFFGDILIFNEIIGKRDIYFNYRLNEILILFASYLSIKIFLYSYLFKKIFSFYTFFSIKLGIFLVFISWAVMILFIWFPTQGIYEILGRPYF